MYIRDVGACRPLEMKQQIAQFGAGTSGMGAIATAPLRQLAERHVPDIKKPVWRRCWNVNQIRCV
jgi:hypothetical protein